MPARPYILVVNGRKVRQPVFVIGAPHSGTDLLARALKVSAGFHLTIGQRAVASVVHAFARSPSIQRGRGEAAATVLRDAFAQAWQVSPYACMACSPLCREAGGVNGAGVCVAERDITRYGDASLDLIYCADGLVDAFPDARIVQIIRDGRDVVAGMLADSGVLAALRPGVANVESEFPNPFFGIETRAHLARPLAGGQVRAALARVGAADGQAAQQLVGGAAHYAPLRADDPSPAGGGQRRVRFHRRADRRDPGPRTRPQPARARGRGWGRGWELAPPALSAAGQAGGRGGGDRSAPGRLRQLTSRAGGSAR